MSRQREAPEVAAACTRLMTALQRRAEDGELEALEALNVMQDHLQLALHRAVLGYRASPARASWADIGRALNMTRQSAHERFSS